MHVIYIYTVHVLYCITYMYILFVIYTYLEQVVVKTIINILLLKLNLFLLKVKIYILFFIKNQKLNLFCHWSRLKFVLCTWISWQLSLTKYFANFLSRGTCTHISFWLNFSCQIVQIFFLFDFDAKTSFCYNSYNNIWFLYKTYDALIIPYFKLPVSYLTINIGICQMYLFILYLNDRI